MVGEATELSYLVLSITSCVVASYLSSHNSRRNVLEENNETRVPAAAAAVDQRGAGAGNPPQNAMGPQPMARQNAQERGNPLGFLGRFFGVANPGQGNNAPRFNNNLNGQQPGIFINYQVQYQFQRRQNENNSQEERLQPPPPFSGFAGPGGAWQPWPAQSQSPATPTSIETPQADGSSRPDVQPPQNASQSVDEQGDIPSAREAARQAALRRFEHQADTHGRPKASTSNSIPQPTVSESNSTSPPQLIPLFDFQHSGGVFHSSSSVAHVSVDDNSNSSPPQISTVNEQDTSTTAPASSRVPRRLTEDQLAQLDTLTRESIDLRLRILDGVSITLNECIDDLMELRSALPLESTPSTTGARGSPSPSDKGKGKEKASELSMPTGEEPILQVVEHDGVDY